MSKPFSTTIGEGIAELVFDHPPVNAFDSAGWAAIAAEIEALGTNDAVRVIIIAAEGRGFCACLLYTSPSPRDRTRSRMPSSA